MILPTVGRLRAARRYLLEGLRRVDELTHSLLRHIKVPRDKAFVSTSLSTSTSSARQEPHLGQWCAKTETYVRQATVCRPPAVARESANLALLAENAAMSSIRVRGNERVAISVTSQPREGLSGIPSTVRSPSRG